MTLLIYAGFHLDRWAVNRTNSFWSLLLFPTYLVVLEGLVSLGPYGTWNSISYTQDSNLPLIQLLSITGIWSITFIIGLTASVLSKVWMEGFPKSYVQKLLLPLIALLTITHTIGAIRIQQHTVKETVAVGACNTSTPGIQSLQNIIINYVQKGSPVELASSYQSLTRNTQQELLLKTRQLANLNAKIVFWPEANAIVLEDDEKTFTNSLIEIANEKGIFILAPIAVIHENSKLITNKVIMVSPGNIKTEEYIKSIIPPGEPSLKGNGELIVLNSPWGKLSTAICFDLDFPGLIRQQRKQLTNILIVPALDWEAIAYTHAAMAKFRAIENGFNIVRYAEGGLHSVVTALGQTLFLKSYNESKEQVSIVEVPTNRIDTFYSFTGDWFLYGNIIGFFTLMLYLLRQGRLRHL